MTAMNSIRFDRQFPAYGMYRRGIFVRGIIDIIVKESEKLIPEPFT